MFMKTGSLFLYTYDIYENKGSCAPGSTAVNALEGSTRGGRTEARRSPFPGRA